MTDFVVRQMRTKKSAALRLPSLVEFTHTDTPEFRRLTSEFRFKIAGPCGNHSLELEFLPVVGQSTGGMTAIGNHAWEYWEHWEHWGQ